MEDSLFERIFGPGPFAPKPSGPNWPDLIKRGTSVVLINGKLYRVTVEEAEVVPKQNEARKNANSGGF